MNTGSHEAADNVPRLSGVPPKDNTLRPSSIPANAPQKPPLFTAFEAQQDILDARSEVYDQLKIKKWWWLLELIPFRERVQLEDGTWKKKWRFVLSAASRN